MFDKMLIGFCAVVIIVMIKLLTDAYHEMIDVDTHKDVLLIKCTEAYNRGVNEALEKCKMTLSIRLAEKWLDGYDTGYAAAEDFKQERTEHDYFRDDQRN